MSNPFTLHSQGKKIGANDALVLPLSVEEAAVVRLDWVVADGIECEFSAEVTLRAVVKAPATAP